MRPEKARQDAIFFIRLFSMRPALALKKVLPFNPKLCPRFLAFLFMIETHGKLKFSAKIKAVGLIQRPLN